MAWLDDYKARVLARRDGITFHSAKRVLKAGYKFRAQVHSTKYFAAVQMLKDDGAGYINTGAYFYVEDEETAVALKLFFS